MIATTAFGVLGAAFAAQIASLLRKADRPDPFTHYLLLAASALLFLETTVRSLAIGFVAVTNTYESLIFYAGAVGAVLFVYRLKSGREAFPLLMLGGTTTAIALLAIASSPLASREIVPPVPALQSHWLVLHVTFAFVGEAFFAVAFVAAVCYLALTDPRKRARVDRVMYVTVAIGYPIFTSGALVFGAVWAQAAWGRYWSWDPKETWALITWLVYTAYLHTRLIRKRRGVFPAVLVVVGFLVTLFTFFGVNYLLGGLHSYG